MIFQFTFLFEKHKNRKAYFSSKYYNIFQHVEELFSLKTFDIDEKHHRKEERQYNSIFDLLF
jgi:hypothetical protein